MSIWDLRAARRRLISQGVKSKDITEESIFKADSELKQLEEESASKTKAARRNQQRRANHSKIAPPIVPDRHHQVAHTTGGQDEPRREVVPFEYDEWE